MKLVLKDEPKAKIKLLSGSAFAINTADHLPKLHQCMILNGKRGSGKSVGATNLLRMYKESGTMDRILVVSPTFESNYRLMKDLDIIPTDVFDPEDPDVIEKIIKIVESERDDYIKYLDLKEHYAQFMKDVKNGNLSLDDAQDDYLLSFFDVRNNNFQMPEPKYKCYNTTPPRPPVLSLFLDDCMSSKLFTNRKFPSMIMRHRHLGAFKDGGALGLSIFIAIQSYKSTSGLPKAIRNQATSICLFRTKDLSELKQIADSFSGEIDPTLFLELYDFATKDSPHDFLFVDLHKKPQQPSMFRKNLDSYIIMETDTEPLKDLS
jgi:hypothetical protein